VSGESARSFARDDETDRVIARYSLAMASPDIAIAMMAVKKGWRLAIDQSGTDPYRGSVQAISNGVDADHDLLHRPS
jgi:hypothetical protein